MRQGIAGAFVLSSVLFASVLFAAVPARAWHPDEGWGSFVLGPLMWIAFFGVVIVLMVLAIHWLGSSGHLTFIA